MNQDIADTEYRIIFLLTNCKGNHASVLFHNDSVQSQRKGNPLVFLDAAIIMGIQKSHLGILIKRILLQIKTGRINVGTQDVHALLHRFRTNDKHSDFLAHIVTEDLVSRLQAFSTLQDLLNRHKACCQSSLFKFIRALTLCLASADKALIFICEGKYLLLFFF